MKPTVQVVVAKLARPHGIRGEVSLEIHTDEPEIRLASGQVLREQDGRRRFTVKTTRWHRDHLLAFFEEIPDRTAAEAVKGLLLCVDVDPAETPADPEEYYDRQLIGLRMLTHEGVDVGGVIGVHHHELQDSLIVELADGSERLVPFTLAVVPTVDLAAGTCSLANIAGLFDEGQ